VAREQADRVAICEAIEQLSGPDVDDQAAELKVRWDTLPTMPSEYAASLTRRFQDACRGFEDRGRRRRLAASASGGSRGWRPNWSRFSPRDYRSTNPCPVAGIRRDADVLREFAETNPQAAERLDRAVTVLEEKEQEQQLLRTKQEGDNLRRLQQLARQLEMLATAEGISLKAGDKALRDIKSALEERAPLPSKQDRQEIQRRLEAARTALGPRVQELRDADEWQRWANLQVQEELCKEMEALKAEEKLDQAARRMRELQSRWKEVALAPVLRAKRSGAASRPPRTRCSAARPRISRPSTKSGMPTWPTSRRSARRPRRWPTQPTGSRRQPPFSSCNPSGSRSGR
jgi:hypothetical protein